MVAITTIACFAHNGRTRSASTQIFEGGFRRQKLGGEQFY